MAQLQACIRNGESILWLRWTREHQREANGESYDNRIDSIISICCRFRRKFSKGGSSHDTVWMLRNTASIRERGLEDAAGYYIA